MPSVAMKHEVEPKERLMKAVGDITHFQVAENQVLYAIYLRPERTLGGIVLPRGNLEEDLYQCKVGLVLKVGEQTDDHALPVKVGDWILVRPADAWAMDVNKAPCRMIRASFVKGIVPDPDMIW